MQAFCERTHQLWRLWIITPSGGFVLVGSFSNEPSAVNHAKALGLTLVPKP